MSLENPTIEQLRRQADVKRFKADLAQLRADELVCAACTVLRLQHQVENNMPVCKGHAAWRRRLCFSDMR